MDDRNMVGYINHANEFSKKYSHDLIEYLNELRTICFFFNKQYNEEAMREWIPILEENKIAPSILKEAKAQIIVLKFMPSLGELISICRRFKKKPMQSHKIEEKDAYKRDIELYKQRKKAFLQRFGQDEFDALIKAQRNIVKEIGIFNADLITAEIIERWALFEYFERRKAENKKG